MLKELEGATVARTECDCGGAGVQIVLLINAASFALEIYHEAEFSRCCFRPSNLAPLGPSARLVIIN